MKLRLLSRDDLRAALPMADAIKAMADAYSQLSAGTAEIPLRSRLAVPEVDGVTLFMPALVPQTHEMAIKVVSVFPRNSQLELPTIHALVLALDPTNGQPLALIEGGSLTALRTGAGSGLATKLLARPEASTVGIFGSGVQARSQLEAVCEVRHIQTVRVYSPTRSHALAFAKEMAGKGPIPENIQVADSPSGLMTADVLCTATTSTTPVFDGDELQPGTHINAVGSFTPEMEEVDLRTLEQSTIFVDSRSAVLEEAGELIGPIQRGDLSEEAIHAEIGEVVLNRAEGRTSEDEITYFKSVGVAVQDTVAAGRALKAAEQANLGTLIEL
ncbi:MAG: ornithine cyclodeaminase family protein [Anaerolineales bacterium]